MNYLESISIFLACWAVIAALDAWKREFIGKRKIDLAERLLAKYHEVNDAISYIRRSFSSIEEGTTRKKIKYESKDETELLNRAYIVFERYEKKKNIFVEFNTLKYQFMATFGKETESIFIETNRVLSNIFISSDMLGTVYWQRQGRVKMEEDEFKKHLDEMHNHEAILWESFSKDDEIKDELKKILLSIEGIIKPCFEETSSLYSILTKKINPFKK